MRKVYAVICYLISILLLAVIATGLWKLLLANIGLW